MRVYLDNAATTPLDERVFEAMKPFLLQKFGNPSSIHAHGREVRSEIEKSRKKIADYLHVSPSEIFFTSGGTEADNTGIVSAIHTYGLRHVITSHIEHHAVLHTIEELEKLGLVSVSYVGLDEKGFIDYLDLEKILKSHPGSLVALMHGNNEIGNITDIARVGELCREFNAHFHSDTVQTFAHFPIDLSVIHIHSICASAHKFHGPKGVGFMYINGNRQIKPLLQGGGQERNMRGGTENVAGIIGLAKAVEIAYEGMKEQKEHILSLKKFAVEELTKKLPAFKLNGGCGDLENSLYTVLNVGIPGTEENDMLLFNLDINGISVSGGSACASGTSIGSHVLEAINTDPNLGTIRMSFSKFNTVEEVGFAIDKIVEVSKA
jgi:cysteine desulfurase